VDPLVLETSPKFPHIYAGLPASAVIGRFSMVRESTDGSFLGIEGLN
jgi:uncharacterized protein (DUF952 family)